MSEAAFPSRPTLAIGSIGRRASGYWGVVFLVLSEASIFAYLFFGYFYFSVQPHPAGWPPSGPPDLTWAIPQTIAVLLAAGGMWWADRAAERVVAAGGVVIGLAAALVLGLAFIALQFVDWFAKPFSFATDPYASWYFIITGAHLAHLVIGTIMAAAVLVWALYGYFGPARHVPVSVAAFYWYFLVAVWVALFFTLYITPFLS